LICRRDGEGWLLITQPAHAWLAGELAAAWGNDSFVTPSPRAAVILATHLHDIGWLGWDGAPRLDEAGQPLNFLDTNLDETIPIWRRGVEQASLLDPYAALLISLHATTIFRRRLARKADPSAQEAKVSEMLAEHESRQEIMRESMAGHPHYAPAVDEEPLRVAYRWLRICDLLSLTICADMLPPSGVLNHVPGANGGDFTRLEYEVRAPFTLALNPWPFAVQTTSAPALEFFIQTRRLKERTFTSRPAFLEALERTRYAPRKVSILAM
jgi:hypothetical protein